MGARHDVESLPCVDRVLSSRTDDAIRDDSQTLLPIDELMSHAETAEMPDELVAAENEDSPADEKPILIDGEATTFGLTNVGCRGTSQIITQDPPVELPFNLFEGLFDGHPLDGKFVMRDCPFVFADPRSISFAGNISNAQPFGVSTQIKPYQLSSSTAYHH